MTPSPEVQVIWEEEWKRQLMLLSALGFLGIKDLPTLVTPRDVLFGSCSNAISAEGVSAWEKIALLWLDKLVPVNKNSSVSSAIGRLFIMDVVIFKPVSGWNKESYIKQGGCFIPSCHSGLTVSWGPFSGGSYSESISGTLPMVDATIWIQP